MAFGARHNRVEEDLRISKGLQNINPARVAPSGVYAIVLSICIAAAWLG